MTDTLEPVAAAKEEVDQEQLAQQLLAQAKEHGVELVGPSGLLSQLTKRVLETALEAEMSDHLGYDKHDPTGRNRGNSRNGVRSKTVLTEIGPVEIEVPRDVEATFTPTIVKKRQRLVRTAQEAPNLADRPGDHFGAHGDRHRQLRGPHRRRWQGHRRGHHRGLSGGRAVSAGRGEQERSA